MEIARLLEGRYAACDKVILVCDNLNTHTKGAFYEAFEPERARALAASASRSFGGAEVCNARNSSVDASATASSARSNASAFAFDGLLKPLIFLTN